jgi:hypothetical protein
LNVLNGSSVYQRRNGGRIRSLNTGQQDSLMPCTSGNIPLYVQIGLRSADWALNNDLANRSSTYCDDAALPNRLAHALRAATKATIVQTRAPITRRASCGGAMTRRTRVVSDDLDLPPMWVPMTIGARPSTPNNKSHCTFRKSYWFKT